MRSAARRFARLHLSVHSRRTYDVGVMAFTRFATFFRPGEPVFPASDSALQEFVAFQSQSCAYGTLKNYIYGVREYHLAQGLPFAPLAERVGVYWALKGVRRVHGRPSQPKQALTFEVLQQVHRHATQHGPLEGDEHTVFTAMLVGMFGLLRKDNLCPGKTRAAHAGAHLRRGDVAFGTLADGTKVAWLRLRRSKTNQFGERALLVPLLEIGGPLCPVTALRKHMADVVAPPDSPLFMAKPAGGRRPVAMTHRFFVARMKRMLGAAGLEPARFAGHSLRRGGATLAFRLGCARHLIQAHGDWLSDVVDRYNEMGPEARLVLPRALARFVATLRP